MSIIVVVVTFNRLSLLKKVIHSLQRQTISIEQIIVVNNGSTDGTFDWLNENSSAIHAIHQENVGGAGGFSRGMECAYKFGSEWIWVMDDDVFPNEDALEMLLSYSTISECIMPRRLYQDGVECKWGYIYDLKKMSIVFGTRSDDCGEMKYQYVNTCCFEGMLINRRIVGLIGFPDKRYFISGDDTAYGLLASRHTHLILVKDAIMIRSKTSVDAKKKSNIFAFYYFRNFHLLQELYCSISGEPKLPILTYIKYMLSGISFIIEAYPANKSTIVSLSTSVLKGYVACILKRTGR